MKEKICFFTTHYDSTRQKLMDFYEYALSDKAEVILLCQEKDKSKFKLKKTKVEGYSCSRSRLLFFLRNYCIKNKISKMVNFTGGGDTTLLLFIALLFTKTKNIMHMHGNIFWKPGDINGLPFLGYTIIYDFKHLPLFFAVPSMHKFLVCSKDITQKMKNILPFSKSKTDYVPSVVDTDFYKPASKASARKRLGIKVNDKVILYVGRISYLKGSDYLQKVIERNPDKKFILVGGMSSKNFNVEKFSNVTHIPGAFGRDLVDYFNAADLCISLSRTEGNSFVPREAMSCGVPALVSDIESLRLLSPPSLKASFNLVDIQKNIDSFFSMSEKKKAELSKRCREFIIKEYSWKNWKKPHQELFLG